MAHLLRDPGREYLVTDLVQTSAQPQPNFAAHIYGSMNAEQLDKEHLRASNVEKGTGSVMPKGGAPQGDGKTIDVLTDVDGLAACDWYVDSVTQSQ